MLRALAMPARCGDLLPLLGLHKAEEARALLLHARQRDDYCLPAHALFLQVLSAGAISIDDTSLKRPSDVAG